MLLPVFALVFVSLAGGALGFLIGKSTQQKLELKIQTELRGGRKVRIKEIPFGVVLEVEYTDTGAVNRFERTADFYVSSIPR